MILRYSDRARSNSERRRSGSKAASLRSRAADDSAVHRSPAGGSGGTGYAGDFATSAMFRYLAGTGTMPARSSRPSLVPGRVLPFTSETMASTPPVSPGRELPSSVTRRLPAESSESP